MGAEDQPWWLNLELFGFEDDDEDDDDESDDESDDDEDEDEDDSDDEESDEDDEDEDDDDEDEDDDEDDKDKKKSKKSKGQDVSRLKGALRKERMARRAAEREVKRLKRGRGRPSSNGSNKDRDKDKGKNQRKDDDEEQETGPSEREVKLAKRLLDKEIDNLVLAAATTARFVDPADAVRLISRKSIEFHQDEEDPTEIEIDEESIEDAVKELARKKKHLIAPRGGSSTKSGSKFGGKKKKDKLSDEAIRKKFGL